MKMNEKAEFSDSLGGGSFLRKCRYGRGRHHRCQSDGDCADYFFVHQFVFHRLFLRFLLCPTSRQTLFAFLGSIITPFFQKGN